MKKQMTMLTPEDEAHLAVFKTKIDAALVEYLSHTPERVGRQTMLDHRSTYCHQTRDYLRGVASRRAMIVNNRRPDTKSQLAWSEPNKNNPDCSI